MATNSKLLELVGKYEQEILLSWLKEQLSAITLRADLMPESELRQQSKEFLATFREGLAGGDLKDITGKEWAQARLLLENGSRSRARQGFTPSETATFIFSLKQPLFRMLQKESGSDVKVLA